jgi:type I restriction enzyme M protein
VYPEDNFEKAKNQSYLRDSDIDQIVNTYQERRNIDKYSFIVPIKEILANDYNLNIPRYVDMFVEENNINLTDISLKLKEIENKIKSNDESIATICKELNIETPF